MALTFTGQSARTNTGINYLAYDGGTRVVIDASSEAIKDFGASAVQNKAASKYANGDFIPATESLPAKVTVRASDFPSSIPHACQ